MEWIIASVGVIIGIIGLAYGYKKRDEVRLDNKHILAEREILKENIGKLQNEQEELKQTEVVLRNKIERYKEEEKELVEKIIYTNAKLDAAVADQRQFLANAKEDYINLIETQYERVEQEHDMNIDRLDQIYDKHHSDILMAMDADREDYEHLKMRLAQAYEDMQQDLKEKTEKEYAATICSYQKEIAETYEELSKIRATRIAAFEAFRKEEEIKNQRAFYCLQLTDNELSDINALNNIKPMLKMPRVLSMLIWSTYFQKPMTALCNNILGTAAISGIYKFTNLNNNMCYIGQAVNVADRWKQHAKCGLDIDTPVGNKLYKAMIAEGLQNFSWELLEACPREQLNEKERYYIELYDSTTFGYNSLSGVKS